MLFTAHDDCWAMACMTNHREIDPDNHVDPLLLNASHFDSIRNI